MRKNWVREKLLAGQPSLGCQIGLGSLHVTELMALAGYEWLVLETEHNSVGPAQLEMLLMAISGTETIPIVRPLAADPLEIQKGLDLGAMGVFVPMVRTAEEAEMVVRATRYPPAGTRGFGPLRASQYTLDYEGYLDDANENMLVALILETREAVENIEAIMDVPGVDALYFGLFDLCLAMGLNPNHLPFPEIDDIMARVLELGKQKGVAIGSGAATPEGLRATLEAGYTFVTYGPDFQLIKDAVQTGIRTFQEVCR
jgi:2-keto-3-deoxy-L-rhamnonate aldolase RhmA